MKGFAKTALAGAVIGALIMLVAIIAVDVFTPVTIRYSINGVLMILGSGAVIGALMTTAERSGASARRAELRRRENVAAQLYNTRQLATALLKANDRLVTLGEPPASDLSTEIDQALHRRVVLIQEAQEISRNG